MFITPSLVRFIGHTARVFNNQLKFDLFHPKIAVNISKLIDSNQLIAIILGVWLN